MATSLLGTTADDRLSGTSGDDDIGGGPGDDVIRGGAGDDVLRGGSGDDVIRGGAGDDVIAGGAGDDDIRGGAGDDVIRGGAGDDVVAGGAGDDVIFGGAGDDVVAGGAGDDVIRGGAGDDIVAGDAGDDVLFGGAGDDVIRGGAGDDVIDGGAGDDVMSGGAGADVFRNAGSFGSDVILDFDKTADRLDLRAFASYELTQAGDDTIVTVAGGQITLRGVTPEGLESAIDIACVVRGTLIRTPAGEVPVETLAAGDMVVTIDGTAKPIRWIGRRSYGSAFVRSNPKVAPIRIVAGTLGTASPAADLLVSPEHAVYVDGALIPARLLVNGGTIRPVADSEPVEYFHLELDAPDVLWTNGALTESYVNHGNRRMFSNWAEYVGRYGSEDEAPRDAGGEYVRRFQVVYGGATLQAVRDRLAGLPLTTAA